MGKRLLFVSLLNVLVLVLAFALYQSLGWIGVPIAVVVVVAWAFYLKLMAARTMRKLFTAPFLMKGAVLRDAESQVHSISPADTPAYEPEWERTDEMSDEEWAELQIEEEKSRQEWDAADTRYFYVDVTITPRETGGEGFSMWEPGDLALAPWDAKSGHLEEEEAGSVEEAQIWRDGEWREDEEGKYAGSQRLRLWVGVPPELQHARFRYYLEVFGEVDFSIVSR